MSGNVKVVARFRPPNALELREGGEITVDFDDGQDTTVKINGGPTSGPEADGFTFDRVFPMGARQQDVFEYGIKETVEDVINGYNGTIFAYGQTGSGKTFTMMGSDIDDDSLKGIIPRIIEQIFASIELAPANQEFLVKVAYMEIYMERIRDLLVPENDNLQVHEEKSRGVYIKGLSDYYVGGRDEVFHHMRRGGNNRKVSSTNMNAESSRSHSIFLVTIQQKNLDTGTQKTGNLYLVDLAGSEKVGKTGASGQTLEEAKKINKSLSALGGVINSLTDGKSSHIPYRDSKLTRILQESLGGNSRTTLIINASPCAYNLDETISTLRFGVRAKSIKNKARVNAELSPTELKALLRKAQSDAAKYTQYIAALEAELKTWRAGGTVPEADRAELGKVSVTSGGTASSTAPSTPARPMSVNGLRSQIPTTPSVDGLMRELSSRPETPTAISIEKDERDEFLRRENELGDQIAEKESALKIAEAALKDSRAELAFYKEQEASLSKDNKSMTAELNEIKLQLERVSYEHKEAAITMDIIKEQNADLTSELEQLRQGFAEGGGNKEAKTAADDPGSLGKQRYKQERVEMMMRDLQMDGFNDKETALRESLLKLNQNSLSSKDSAHVRDQMLDIAAQHRELSRQLLDTEKDRDFALSLQQEAEDQYREMKAAHDNLLEQRGAADDEDGGLRAALEAQYHHKHQEHLKEVALLKKEAEDRARDMSSVQLQLDTLRAEHEEISRAFAATTASVKGGEDLHEQVKEMERVRKTMTQQLSEFDVMKRSLMRDLQNRCEKVVELEISLDESREQYNNVVRSSNTKTQQKKMSILERNLEQLTNVQRQLVEQNSQLKRDCAIAERKLNARNERIQNLEVLLADAQDKLLQQTNKYDSQMALVRERFEQAKKLSSGGQGGLNSSSGMGPGGNANFGRIAKPLRGGGAPVATQQSSGMLPNSSSPAPRHPGILSAQQQQGYSPASEPSKAAKSRSSWFFSSSNQ